MIFLVNSGCKKYLDQKPDMSLVIPGSLSDLQALLDNYRKTNLNDPDAGEISSDNYYLTTADWNNLSSDFSRMYTWQKDHLFTTFPNMWSNAYNAIYVPNVVLDNLKVITETVDNHQNWDNIKGEALFFRAKEFHQVACTWALAYDSLTSKSDLGIPLRVNSDFNIPSTRGNLEATYDTIIDDLKQSVILLPVTPLSRAVAF